MAVSITASRTANEKLVAGSLWRTQRIGGEGEYEAEALSGKAEAKDVVLFQVPRKC